MIISYDTVWLVAPIPSQTTPRRAVPQPLGPSLSRPGDNLKSDRVAAEFERKILAGELASGTRLPTEAELCGILAVSRSVVRDAVRALAARGLVTVKQGQGMTVAEPDDSAFSHALVILLARSNLTMGDVMNARAAVETRLVPIAASCGTERDWDALQTTLDTYADAVDAGDWSAAGRAHVQFHVGLLRAIHQPALELFLKPMTEIIIVSSVPPRLNVKEDWEVHTHPPILDALRRSDTAATEKAMEDHFAATTDPRRYGAFRAQPFSHAFTFDGLLASSRRIA